MNNRMLLYGFFFFLPFIFFTKSFVFLCVFPMCACSQESKRDKGTLWTLEKSVLNIFLSISIRVLHLAKRYLATDIYSAWFLCT